MVAKDCVRHAEDEEASLQRSAPRAGNADVRRSSIGKGHIWQVVVVASGSSMEASCSQVGGGMGAHLGRRCRAWWTTLLSVSEDAARLLPVRPGPAALGTLASAILALAVGLTIVR